MYPMIIGQEGKTRVLGGYYGIQKFDRVIMPRVIPEAEEVNAVKRGPYPQTVRPER